MKQITFSPTFQKKLRQLHSKNIRLTKKITKKIQIQLNKFQENPKHPSLRLHKLKGNLQNTWSLSITKSFRLIFIKDKQHYFFDLDFHDKIYKK